jgi:hypothetical protein
MGDHPNDKYAGCFLKVYPQLVAWEDVGEDTNRSYSACLREILQNDTIIKRQHYIAAKLVNCVQLEITSSRRR